MGLVNLILILIIIGVLLYLVNNYIPMIDSKIKQIINAVVIIAVVIWLIQLLFGPLPDIRVGR